MRYSPKVALLVVALAPAAVTLLVDGFAPSVVHHARRTTTAAAPTVLRAASEATDAFESYDSSDPAQELAFRDVVVGDGPVVEEGQVVVVAYTGRVLATGKQFDTGEGYAFKLGGGRVVPGWEKGLKGMRVGGKRTLRIPPKLAYGDEGAGSGVIPPGAHIEFDTELVKIVDNPIESAIAMLNWNKERKLLFVALTIFLAVSPQIDKLISTIKLPSFN